MSSEHIGQVLKGFNNADNDQLIQKIFFSKYEFHGMKPSSMCPSVGSLNGCDCGGLVSLVVRNPDVCLCVDIVGDPIVAAVDDAEVGLPVEMFIFAIFILIIFVALLFCCTLDARKASSSCERYNMSFSY